MNLFLLTLHNLTRWLVIAAALWAIWRAVSGWLGGKEWLKQDDRAGLFYTSLLDVQVLIGFWLYIFPGTYTRMAFADFGAAMRSSEIRFFAVEHFIIMLAALAIAHIGRVMVKKAPEAVRKHRRAAIWFGISVLAILLSVPWPFLDHGRPLLRLLGFTL